METKIKRNLIIWGVILLVVLNISSLSTIWYHRYQYNHNRLSKTSLVKRMSERNKRHTKYSQKGANFIAKGLDLAADQRQDFDSIWLLYTGKRNEIEHQMQINHRQMAIVMNQMAIDTMAFNKISAGQANLMLELNHSLMEMNLALRSILNEDQLKLFIERVGALNKRQAGMPGRPSMRKRAN
jgi:hypothetical protein